jgi:hypothetical protein
LLSGGHSSFGVLRHCYEDRYQLIALGKKLLDFGNANFAVVPQQFEPQDCFVRFLRACLNLGDEISSASGSRSLSEVCSYGGSRSQQLLSYHLHFGSAARQCAIKANDSTREQLCSFLEIHPFHTAFRLPVSALPFPVSGFPFQVSAFPFPHFPTLPPLVVCGVVAARPFVKTAGLRILNFEFSILS